MNKELFEALSALEQENHIEKDVLIEKIKQGIMKAIKRDYPMSEHITVDIDPDNNKFEMKLHKEVMDVKYVDDPDNEIWIEEARTYDPNIQVGDWVDIPSILQDSAELRLRTQNSRSSTISRTTKRQDLSNSIRTRSVR